MTVGGRDGFVALVTANQLTVQLPTDAPVGATNMIVRVNNVASEPFAITLDTHAPGLFTADGSGTGAGLIRTQANAQVTTTAPAKTGDTLSAFAVGLGATMPATPTGVAGAANPTAVPPTVTVGGEQATVVFAGVVSGQAGLYQINFTVPEGVQGTAPVEISIGGETSNEVTLALSGITSVVNNASFGSAGTASPGSIVSVFANGIGTTDQTVGFPSTTFQGVSVRFNGAPAPIFHLVASAGQIDLLLPYDLPSSGSVNVQLSTPSGNSLDYMLAMEPATPGLYFAADPNTEGRFNVLAQFNGTVWLAMPSAMATAINLPICAGPQADPLGLCGQPAAPGDNLVLYTTGLGKATPDGDPNGPTLPTGQNPPADGSVLYRTVATPTVTVGGLPATVQFSGLSPGFAGLYQVNFQVPVGVTGDDVPVSISVGDSEADVRTIAIHTR
jgi:uncharacterized protein (TIGR03437 family)